MIQMLTVSVVQRPWATLCFVALITLISVGITGRFLSFKTNRADLIDPNTPYHQRWLRFVDRFGDDSELVIAVEGTNEQELRPVLDHLGACLESEKELFDRVLYKVDPGSLQRKALQYLAPGELEKALARLEMYSPILSGHWNRAGLESYCRRLADFIQRSEQQHSTENLPGALQQSEQLIHSLDKFVRHPGDFSSPWPEVVSASAFPHGGTLETRYQITPSGKMGFVVALPRDVSANFSGKSASLSRLREIIRAAQDRFPKTRIGVTGIPVLEADEMERSQQDMTVATVISFVGVGFILLVGFRGFRHPLLSMVMLAVAISWCLGYTTIAVGHLNILSVSFAAILIGLGIDYAIHYLAHYLELRHQGHSLLNSLTVTSRHVGTGIVTAAVTTAVAFFCATFTNFLGVAELGIIAGGGILLCAMATFLVLPSLIVLADEKLEPRQLPTPFQGNVLRRITRDYPLAVAGVTLAIIIGIGCQAFSYHDGRIWSRVKYDYNLLNLQAKGLESVELQKRIFNETNGSLLYAVSMTDSAQKVRLLKEKFLELPTVSRVEELGSFMPAYPAGETNLLVQAIHARLSALSELPREFPQLNPLSIGQGLESLYQVLRDRPEPETQAAAQVLNDVLNRMEQLSVQQQLELLAGYQQGMLMALHRQFQMLAAISDPEPVSPTDLPDALRSRFVSDFGDWLIRVYPTEQIWDEVPLSKFVQNVRTVDPEITGTPLQNYEAARQIQSSYLHAAVYALAAIALILLIDALELGPMIVTLFAPLAAVALSVALVHGSEESIQPIWLISVYISVAMAVAAIFDFTSVRDTFLALLPAIGGIFMMFGILGIAGIDLNPANLIVLPLILGIGVDDGVHVLHGYRLQKGPYETAPSTINAVTLTSLTTMVGFGSMVVAAHQGLVTLGLVLVIGVGSCLFISLVLLPAVLTLIPRRTSDLDADDRDRQDELPAEDEELEAHVVPIRGLRSA